MRRKPIIDLRQSQRGAAAVEFAFAGPVLILLILVIVQLGLLFLAQAGLQHKIGESARFATLYPRRDDAAILQKIDDSGFGLGSSALIERTVTHGSDHGSDYVIISITYSVPIGMGLLGNRQIRMTQERRVYLP